MSLEAFSALLGHRSDSSAVRDNAPIERGGEAQIDVEIPTRRLTQGEKGDSLLLQHGLLLLRVET
ncbi:MAG: hypothetical protein ABI895_34710 [Deltaproteobacteria bacterium]